MAIEFNAFVRSILDVRQEQRGPAARSVNLRLTLRNWIIGFRTYPQIVGTLSPQLQCLLLADRVAYE